MNEIYPGHGAPGIQKARQRLIHRLGEAAAEVLGVLAEGTGPGGAWALADSYPRLIYGHDRGAPNLRVEFSANVTLYCTPWPHGPGTYEPGWHYNASVGGVMTRERQAYFLPEPPAKTCLVISAWHSVFQATRVVG